MKEIKAFIHKHRISSVIEALKAADIAITRHANRQPMTLVYVNGTACRARSWLHQRT